MKSSFITTQLPQQYFRPVIARQAEEIWEHRVRDLANTKKRLGGLPGLAADGDSFGTAHALMSYYIRQATDGSDIMSRHAARVLDPLPNRSEVASLEAPLSLWQSVGAHPITPSGLLGILSDPQDQVIEVQKSNYGGAITSYMPHWQQHLGALGLNLYFQEIIDGKVHSLARIPSFTLLQSALIAACGPGARIGFTSEALDDEAKNDWLRNSCYPIRMNPAPLQNPKDSAAALEAALLDATLAIRYFTSTPFWMRSAASRFYDNFFNPMGDNVTSFIASLGSHDRFSRTMIEQRSRLASGIFTLKFDHESNSVAGDFSGNLRTIIGLVLSDSRFDRMELPKLLREYNNHLIPLSNFVRSDELVTHINAINRAIAVLDRCADTKDVLREIK